MKKNLLLVASALFLLSAVSCNSDSDPSWAVYGSLQMEGFMSGKVIIAADGTKLYAESGFGQLPDLPDGLNRQFVGVSYTYLEENYQGVGPDKTLQIRPIAYSLNETRVLRELDAGAKDDPIIMLAGEKGSQNIVNGASINTLCNFLFFQPIAYGYRENKTSDWPYSLWDFEVQVDPVIEAGERLDTIHMYLKFDVNRKEEEEPYAIFDSYNVMLSEYFAVDLEDASMLIQSPEFDPNETYIIKLHYRGYQVGDYNDIPFSIEDDVILDKYATCEWTPGNPYGLNE